MKKILFILAVLILLSGVISIASADAADPPESINVFAQINYGNEHGIFWFDPPDTDFHGVNVYVDNVFIETVLNGTGFYNDETIDNTTHLFSTQTVDTFGNVNASWINVSTYDCAAGCALCCYVPPSPTGTPCPSPIPYAAWCPIETPSVTPTPGCFLVWCPIETPSVTPTVTPTITPTVTPTSTPCPIGEWCPV